jgi:hypothetical protein
MIYYTQLQLMKDMTKKSNIKLQLRWKSLVDNYRFIF